MTHLFGPALAGGGLVTEGDKVKNPVGREETREGTCDPKAALFTLGRAPHPDPNPPAPRVPGCFCLRNKLFLGPGM